MKRASLTRAALGTTIGMTLAATAFVAGPAARAATPSTSAALTAAPATAALLTGTPSTAATACTPWTANTVASGLGSLENALIQPDGSVLVSDLIGNRVAEVETSGPNRGKATTVVADLPNAGGLARHGSQIYVTTGDNALSGLFGVPDGTIQQINPATGSHRAWARGLIMPNGLAMLPDGSAVATRNLTGLGTDSKITRVTPRPSGSPTVNLHWSNVTDTNGVAVAPGGAAVYVGQFLSARAQIWRVPLNDPQHPTMVADLGAGTDVGLDDLTVTPDGMIYIAADYTGGVYRVNPANGTSCLLAKNLPFSTAVEAVSNSAGKATRLYVTSVLGTLYSLTPAS
jgi:sugar lactone lactonase YvrE